MRRLSLVLLAALASCAPGGNDQATLVPKTVIFFEHASVALQPAAQGLVAHAAREARRDPTAGVTVAGYAAAHGDIDADAQLAAERARLVAALLEADGVAANRIAVIPRAPTNEAPPVAARRVEITVGAPS
jgi:outer membrane protein OmpA-like peptidoglycan-associated protein